MKWIWSNFDTVQQRVAGIADRPIEWPWTSDDAFSQLAIMTYCMKCIWSNDNTVQQGDSQHAGWPAIRPDVSSLMGITLMSQRGAINFGLPSCVALVAKWDGPLHNVESSFI